MEVRPQGREDFGDSSLDWSMGDWWCDMTPFTEEWMTRRTLFLVFDSNTRSHLLDLLS